MHNGLPNMGEIGFKRDIVCFDNSTYVVYDPECPSGHMACAQLRDLDRRHPRQARTSKSQRPRIRARSRAATTSPAATSAPRCCGAAKSRFASATATAYAIDGTPTNGVLSCTGSITVKRAAGTDSAGTFFFEIEYDSY
jgi:hypothetical protein